LRPELCHSGPPPPPPLRPPHRRHAARSCLQYTAHASCFALTLLLLHASAYSGAADIQDPCVHLPRCVSICSAGAHLRFCHRRAVSCLTRSEPVRLVLIGRSLELFIRAPPSHSSDFFVCVVAERGISLGPPAPLPTSPRTACAHSAVVFSQQTLADTRTRLSQLGLPALAPLGAWPNIKKKCK